jgi:hypothetical protein
MATLSTRYICCIKRGSSDSVSRPCAIVPPNGPSAARCGSTWIHWWSSVASANRSTRSWPISSHSVGPSSVPSAATNSSSPSNSQGAAVPAYTVTGTVPAGYALPPGISGPLPPAVADHIAAVVLFGTPREWIINIADNSAPPIAIGSSLSARTVEFCATGDPICSPGGLDRAAHSAYKVNGMADEAAVFAANALSAG